MQEAIVEPDRVGMGVAQVRQRVPRAHCTRFDTVLPGLKRRLGNAVAPRARTSPLAVQSAVC